MHLYFREFGNKDAPTIVFIHGGGVGGWMWKNQIKHFKNYHCLVPDLPEHGKSYNIKPFSIKESVNRIAELIELYSNNGKAHLIGHSVGARIVIDLLCLRPELVIDAIVASAIYKEVPLIKLFHRQIIYNLTVLMIKSEVLTSFIVKLLDFPDKEYEKNCKEGAKLITAGLLYRIYEEL